MPEFSDDELSSPDGAVTVAYVHSEEVAHSWHISLVENVAYDMANNCRIMRGGWVAVQFGTDGLQDARNKGVEIFLEERDAEWMLWVDTDMGFAPGAIDALVEAADPVDRPVIGGLCFTYKQLGPDGMGGQRAAPRATIFDWKMRHGQMGFLGRANYPPDSLVQCSGTGSAFILIHRSVLLKIREKFGDNWYTKLPNPDPNGEERIIGEDLSFCMRVAALGIPLFVHTGVRTNHLKPIWVGETDYIEWAIADKILSETIGDEPPDGLTIQDQLELPVEDPEEARKRRLEYAKNRRKAKVGK